MKSIEELLNSEGIIPERPPSLDEKGRRLDIFPAQVKGYFRTRRTMVYNILIFIFLILPWLSFNGKQLVFLDIVHREFTFFGLTLLAHDGPVIFLLLGVIVFSLLLATALYGRVWCGWACPQTVFIDRLYRKVEEWIEGNHIQRQKLAQSKMTQAKFAKKALKWFFFILISSHIAHSFTAYFVGAKKLVWISLENPVEHLGLFIFVQVVTFLSAINFGWFKEQFCLIACPYGRFQSVVMDQKSQTVFYDEKRGEPRREKKGVEFADCVNCFKCVSVCPTGIDIRDGKQMECIDCTACIDACDTVMEKLNKPKGLIRITSEEEIGGVEKKKQKLNLRALMYGVILSIFLLSLIYFGFSREEVSVKLIRAVEAPFTIVKAKEGDIVSNHFRIHVTNQSADDMGVLFFKVQNKEIQLVVPGLPVKLKPQEQKWIHVFLKIPRKLFTNEKIKENWTLGYKVNNIQNERRGVFTLLGPSVE